MDEDKKRDYLDEKIVESRSRVLISVIASVLILSCALFMVYFLYMQQDPTELFPPVVSDITSSPVESQAISVPDDESIDTISERPADSSDESLDFSGDNSVDQSLPPDESEDESSDESIVIEVVYGKTYNNVYVYGDTAVTLLGGSSSNEKRFADAISRYKEKYTELNIYTCIVPSYVEFYRNGDDKKVSTASQKDIISNIYGAIDERIIKIDAYSALETKIDEYLYYRTDPNWTSLGAYYAYCSIIEAMGQTPVALGEYEADTINEFLGENYVSTMLPQLQQYPDSITFYKTDLKYPSNVTHVYSDGTIRENTQMVYKSVSNPIMYGYMIFGCRGVYTKAVTENTNGKKLLVLADDTRSALMPYFTAHFQEIHVGEIRSFGEYINGDLDKFIQDNGITDILFVSYTTNARNLYRVNNLNDLLSD